MRFALIDISHIFKTTLHASGDKPISYAVQTTLGKVHDIYNKTDEEGNKVYDNVACCFDMKPYYRNTLFPQYKANREPDPPEVVQQYQELTERVKEAGYVAWGEPGFEADDIIASACELLLNKKPVPGIDIYSADKDLMQLVQKMVSVVSTRTGETYHEGQVYDKFVVHPAQIVDYLALMGDKADNLPGVPGLGPKKSALLIREFGNIEGVISAAKSGKIKSDSMANAIIKAEADIRQSLLLIELNTEAPICVEEIYVDKLKERTEKMGFEDEEPYDIQEIPDLAPETEKEPEPALIEQKPQAIEKSEPQETVVYSHHEALLHAIELRKGLFLTREKSSFMWQLANRIHASRMFNKKFQSPEQIYTVMLTGTELGLGPMASLQNFHMIQGKPSPASHLLISLAKGDPDCEYFECTEHNSERAKYVCKKKSYPKELTFEYTIQDAIDDGLDWANKSKNKKAMLRKTAGCQASRLFFPEATCGLYGQSELGFEEGE